MENAKSATAEEDRILRDWTPRILRTILIVSSIILVIGIAATAAQVPGYYVRRFYAVKHGHVQGSEKFATLVAHMRHGDPRSIMTIGLYILTLVPLARVAFTFFLFLKERDYIFVAATAYVLAGLIFGVMLGRIG
ncbi:MAG TPA: DUF1634 domain-containing protein [Candidatus Binataceae bacterium]|nr:DUF1634 domain-containing protein [Candidatus Binataceae bacterium]